MDRPWASLRGLDWAVALLALLNIWMLGRKMRSGWLVKGAGQLASAPLNAANGLWGFATLSLVGAVLSVWSWWEWGRDGGDGMVDTMREGFKKRG